MIVYFLRHASAGQHKASERADEKRALDHDGTAQARHVGRVLAAMNVELDAVITSPLKRAVQTAALVANELGFEQKLELDVALRPEATFESFRRLLAQHDRQDAVMVVGHNPSLSSFLSLVLTKGSQENMVDFKKGAVAKVEMKGTRSGVLSWLLTPKLAQHAYEVAETSSRPKTARK